MNKRGTSIVAQMRKVQALHEKEQALGTEITALQVSRRECADTYQEQLSDLVSKMATAAGIHRLPLAVIGAGFKHIVDCGSDPRIANEWIAKYSGAAITKGVRDPDVGSRTSEPERGSLANKVEGRSLVSVRLGSNTSKTKKDALRKAGLKWNGRRRLWIGEAGAEAQADLCELFGDRVQIQMPLKRSTARSRSQVAEKAPEDATVGDATTSDAPMPDYAGPAGASCSTAPPATPPVDRGDTAVTDARGDVVVGPEAAAANAGDASVAPVAVLPPIVTKSPSPPPKPVPRFPNFPRAGARVK